MSAFQVSNAHIHVLVAAHARASKYGRIAETMTDDELGQLFIRENMRSMSARYRDSVDEVEIAAYHYDPRHRPLSIVEMIKAIHCYTYQACEHDEWTESKAHKFCDRILNSLTHEIPGYDQAPWGFEPSHLVGPIPIGALR
jgi:hypothetical protein